jgi:hypothetical protein
MWRKALIVLALFGSAGATQIRPLVGEGLGSHCTDRICACRRHSAPSAPAKPHCHDEQGRSSAEMSAACQHGGDPAAPAPAPPRVLPAVASLVPPAFSRLSALPLLATVSPGHLRHDLPPPRTAA